jgi:glycosyltransferase involved in cell wall biosynthesis
LSLHILVVPSWYSTGDGSGGGYFRDQALALAAAGHRVGMLAPAICTLRDLRAGRGEQPRRARPLVEDCGVRVYRRSALTLIPRLPYRNALAWTRCGIRLARCYAAENGWPDLVHAHSCLNAGVLALALDRRFGIPFVVTEHSAGPLSPRPWERVLITRVAKRARHCFAVSPFLAARLQREYPGSRWHYLPNVLGAAFFAPLSTASIDCGARPFLFACVARLSPEKGHMHLIRAFAEAFAGGNERLRLIGDGSLRAPLEDLANRLGIADRVEFTGTLPPKGVRAQLAAADAFVLASTGETFGVAIIEALACGLPVVSTASGGPDHLIDATNGFLVPPGDTGALRTALLRMRREAAHHDRAAIRADALRRYGPDAFARQFAAMIS